MKGSAVISRRAARMSAGRHRSCSGFGGGSSGEGYMTKHRTVLIVAASTVALAAVIAATLPDRSTLPVAAPSRDGNSGRALDPGAVERPPSSLIGEEGSGLWSAPLEAVMRLARAGPGPRPAWPRA